MNQSTRNPSTHSHAEPSLTEGHAHPHAHVHSEESLRSIVNRLSRIEGHVRRIKTMVQESRACPDVLVRGALHRRTAWHELFWMST